VTLVLVACAVGYGVALWRVPDWTNLKGSSDVARDRHNARLLVVSVGGAIVVAGGLLFTWRGYRLSRFEFSGSAWFEGQAGMGEETGEQVGLSLDATRPTRTCHSNEHQITLKIQSQ
jgi:ribosomal protein L27